MSSFPLLFVALLCAIASAAPDEEAGDPPPTDDPGDTTEEPAGDDTSEPSPADAADGDRLSEEDRAAATPAPLFIEPAEDPGTIDADQLGELKPERHKMEQDPYAWRPWAAYALEFGEARVGLGGMAVGVAPRVELGTQVPLDALGVYNGRLKVDALRLGPVDFAVVGSIHSLPSGSFSGQWIQAGGLLSVRIADPVTFHVGSRWGRITADGLPDLGAAGSVLSGGQTDELDAWLEEAREQGVSLSVERTAVTAQAAVDLRFNRRDSLVLQATATPWASGARSTEGIPEEAEGTDEEEELEDEIDGLPPILLLDELLESGDTVGERLGSSYVATLAYQANYKNATLRIGFGLSAVPYAWLLQSTELAFHFGGKTRSGERRMRRGWRQNRRDLDDGGDAGAAAGG
jgi:hypothetical protein